MYSPLSSSKTPHFQNEAKCTAFLMKMSFICMRMKIISISKAEQLASFWYKGPGNSEIAYCNDNSQVWKTWLACVQQPPSLPPPPLPFPSPTSLQHTRDTHSSLNYHSYALVLTKLKSRGAEGLFYPTKFIWGKATPQSSTDLSFMYHI